MSAFVQHEKGGLVYMTAPVISTKHAFTTRYGGVSEGYLASLNLGFNRGDERERVLENYRILGRALGIDVMRAAYTKQVHGTHVRLITESDRCSPTDPDPCDSDGLVTDVPGLPIFCFTADCVPLLLHDPVRGTAGAGTLRLAQLSGRHPRRGPAHHGGTGLQAGGRPRRNRPLHRRLLL